MKSCKVSLSLVSSHSSYTWLRYSFQTPFWCYISIGGHPDVTPVQGGILADYDQNVSRGWDSPDTKFQLPQGPRNYVPLTVYVENLVLSQRLTDPILAVVVSRQFRVAYWLITTKLIHMSWSQILPSLVILSIFTFELHVIELFLPNSGWCDISVGGHPGVTSVQGGILNVTI